MSSIAEAASVLLARGPGSQEVYVVRRSEKLKFFGGFHAFPGGRIAPEDAHLPAGLEDPLAVRRMAAARELFEETGVLVARDGAGSFPRGGTDLEQQRREMALGRVSFPDVLQRLGLSVRAEDFRIVGALTTPAFAAIRFDTTFFTAALPPGQQADIWPGELDEGHWTTAAGLLESWTRGECLVSPPSLLLLESFRGHPVSELPARFAPYLTSLGPNAHPPIFFAPAVQMIPLHTVALPPSTHTNAYLVGTGPAYLLDPGTSEPAEQEHLFQLLDAWQARGGRLTAVILSHHHPDHIGAAGVCARRYGVPVWAHPWTAAALRGKIEIARELHDGDQLDLGTAPDGSGPWHLEALHTPGHDPGHLAFYEPRYRLQLAGDMVSTASSIIIAPPDGDLGVYLDSLRRLQRYDSRLLLPSHGSPSARPDLTLTECIEHRARREQQLLAALSPAPRKVDDLAAEMYRGLAPSLLGFARLQVLAGLRKLQREGLALEVNNGAEPGWGLKAGG